MVEQATALLLLKEFPETHFAARAEDLVRLDRRRRPGPGRGPYIALWDRRMLLSYFTTVQPMKGLASSMM